MQRIYFRGILVLFNGKITSKCILEMLDHRNDLRPLEQIFLRLSGAQALHMEHRAL